MRMQLVQGIARLLGHRLSQEEARLNWDVSTGVVGGFAALVGSAFLWEPVYSRAVVAKLLVCGGVVLVSILLAFRRKMVGTADLCFVATRWMIAAFVLRSPQAITAAVIVCLIAVIAFFYCMYDQNS
jgi:hypothetical protein